MYVRARKVDGGGPGREDERGTRKIRRRGRRGTRAKERPSVLTQAGSYRAAQTNKLELYLELEDGNTEDDEETRARGCRARGTRETENSGQSFVIAK